MHDMPCLTQTSGNALQHNTTLADNRMWKASHKANQGPTYKGVSAGDNLRKWRAQIWDGNRVVYLGIFSNDLDAARCYDQAVIKLIGPCKSKLNFPAEDYPEALSEWKSAQMSKQLKVLRLDS